MFNFHSLEKKYFDIPLSSGFVALYTGKTIAMAVTALLGIFLPIFLYELFGNNFQLVIFYYTITSFFYGITVFFGARFLNKFGFRRALRTSVILGALFYGIFYFINLDNLHYLIPFSILVVTFYRLLYWLPYHVDFAKFTDKRDRARQVSVLEASRHILGIFIPIIAGYIVARFSFDVLFLIGVILFLVSGIPYLMIPRTREKFSWSLSETWQQFFSKEKRKVVLAYFAYGAETVVGIVVWPIFIYQLLKGNYFQVGAISTLIIGFAVILQLALGKYIDLKSAKEKVLGWGSVFYALGWLIKIFIETAFQIFVVGAYHSVSRIFLQTPFNALSYEIAADQGHYVDEFTVLHQMADSLGRAFMGILVIIVSFYLAIQWTFLLAALAAIIFNLLGGYNYERIKHRI